MVGNYPVLPLAVQGCNMGQHIEGRGKTAKNKKLEAVLLAVASISTVLPKIEPDGERRMLTKGRGKNA